MSTEALEVLSSTSFSPTSHDSSNSLASTASSASLPPPPLPSKLPPSPPSASSFPEAGQSFLFSAPPKHLSSHARTKSSSATSEASFITITASSSLASINGPPPIPGNKPSWLKRTTSGSRSIASNLTPRDEPLNTSNSSRSSSRGPSPTPTNASVPLSAPTLPPRSAPSHTLTFPDSSRSLPSLPSSTSTPRISAPPIPPSISKASLPPPPSRTTALPPRGRSEDTARRVPPTGGLSGGLKSGLAGVNRRLGAWAGDQPPGGGGGGAGATARGVAGQAAGLLQAGGGLIGGAVSSGWSAWRGGRAGGGGAHSESLDDGGPGGSGGNGGLGGGQMEGARLVRESVKRHSRIGYSKEVFGRDITEVAAAWPVSGLEESAKTKNGVEGEAGRMTRLPKEKREKRREGLPAVALRCVDYLELWAPKEEGIFRISGRSSHVALLRKEFDAGADLDLTVCDPGDIDPHAVASLYKSYLRELPPPILTLPLSASFDDLVLQHLHHRAQESDFGASSAATQLRDASRDTRSSLEQSRGVTIGDTGTKRNEKDGVDDGKGWLGELRELLEKLPEAHWFLLADLTRLLLHTSKSAAENKMTTQNLVMVFCPSTGLSPGFLRLLIEEWDVLFGDAEEARKERAQELEQETLIDPKLSGTKEVPERGSSIADRMKAFEQQNGSTNGPAPKTKGLLNSRSEQPPRLDLGFDEAPKAEKRASPVIPPKSEAVINQFRLNVEGTANGGNKFSTPIADKFARTRPVSLNLRGDKKEEGMSAG